MRPSGSAEALAENRAEADEAERKKDERDMVSVAGRRS